MPSVVQLKTVLKARALVLRPGPELLVLDHPLTLWQVPGGGIEADERPAQAAERELFEEAGLQLGAPRTEIEARDVVVPGGAFGERDYEYQRWHGFVFDAPSSTPDVWEHAVAGEGIDAGSRYRYRWTPLRATDLPRFEARFRPLLRRLIRHLERSP